MTVLLVFFSAFLHTLGSPNVLHLPAEFGCLMPLSLVPLFYVLFSQGQQHSLKKNIFFVWMFGFLFHLVVFYWISQPLIYFGGMSEVVGHAFYVLISSILAFYFVFLFAPLLLFVKKHQEIPSIVWALIFTFFEIFLPRFFEWSCAEMMSSISSVNQLSSLFGFHTGSFFVFYTNIALARALFRWKSSHHIKDILRPLLAQGMIWTTIVLFGLWRISFIEKELEHSPKYRIAYVQPNFIATDILDKALPATHPNQANLPQLLEMSQEAISKSIAFDGKTPDLLAWSESAAPLFVRIFPHEQKAISFFIQQHENVPILMQSISWGPQNERSKYILHQPMWSSSFVMTAQGILPKSFQKWERMPLGEMLPFEDSLPFLRPFFKEYFTTFKNFISLSVGSSYAPVIVPPHTRIAPLICFDAISQKLAFLQSRHGGAQIFVNQANFSWMVDSDAGHQFSILGQSRALENGRSFVLVANSGPTQAFDPLGRPLSQATPLLTPATGFVDVPLYEGRTLFFYVYDWPLVILGWSALAYWGYCVIRARRILVSPQ